MAVKKIDSYHLEKFFTLKEEPIGGTNIESAKVDISPSISGIDSGYVRASLKELQDKINSIAEDGDRTIFTNKSTKLVAEGTLNEVVGESALIIPVGFWKVGKVVEIFQVSNTVNINPSSPQAYLGTNVLKIGSTILGSINWANTDPQPPMLAQHRYTLTCTKVDGGNITIRSLSELLISTPIGTPGQRYFSDPVTQLIDTIIPDTAQELKVEQSSTRSDMNFIHYVVKAFN